ncbi:MAG: hypothetical protein NC429_06180 [Lachnospiraceae bacterium]|nr:hypothetical protein [Lachnospiraceae bacterium]
MHGIYKKYTIHNKCEEVPELDYDDGLKFIYFNTKGQKGGSQAIKNMLTYFQNSDSKNVVDDATRMIDSYVSRVKNLPEVEAGYMTLGDWIDDIIDDAKKELREEMKEEVREEIRGNVKDSVKLADIKILIETVHKYHDTKENAVIMIQENFPEYADQAQELIEKYWKEI